MASNVKTATPLISRRRVLEAAVGGTLAAAVRPRIAAAAKAPELRFLSVGDWGRAGHFDQQRVGAQMGRTADTFGSRYILSVGDNFYEDGVGSTSDPQWQSSFERIYDAPSLRSPWRVILGNHDYRGNVQAQLDYHALDNRWNLPARYYQITDRLADGTPCDFFYIDTNPFISRYRGSKVRIEGQDTAAQRAWLERALASSTAPWKIVVGHHPLYTAAGGKLDEPDLIAAIGPLLRDHKVQAYINGHVHNLQHLKVDGIDYITNGAGSKLEGAEAAQPGGVSFLQHGFMTVRMDADALDFAFIGDDGKPLYDASIARTIG